MTEKHNGYSNYETWNIVLWLDNDESFNSIAQSCNNYDEFKRKIAIGGTPDSVSWWNTAANIEEINQTIWGNE